MTEQRKLRHEAPRRRAADGPIVNAELIDWLARRSGLARQVLADRVRLARQRLQAAESAERFATTGRIAERLREFYGSDGFVTLEIEPDHAMPLSVVSRSEWIGLGHDLMGGVESGGLGIAPPTLAEIDIDAAVRRLADIAARDIRIHNRPAFDLTSIDSGPAGVLLSYGIVDFVEYAFSYDLLEGEMSRALEIPDADLPLRRKYLPDRSSLLDVGSRICLGGPLALFAVARNARIGTQTLEDYVLLVQRRSTRVVNVPGRLAVIPKGFHQPLVEPGLETPVNLTLIRELEEELMGRADLDPANADWAPAVDPYHSDHASDPMRWIQSAMPGSVRVEIVGFGLNAVSGNFEVPSLIAVMDPEFWTQFGGSLDLGWESADIVRVSSKDRASLTRLMLDETWSNESLFAFGLALRRLADIDPTRVDVPDLELTLS
jgi:hypothetical protein